jgi:hypothetical protein
VIRYKAQEALSLADTVVGFLVTYVLMWRFRPAWTLQFAAVTYGLLLLGTVLLPFMFHRDVVGHFLMHGTAVRLGVCMAVFFIDHKHLWAWIAGALLYIVLMFAGLMYADRRWPPHARTSEQQSPSTENSEE